MFLLSDKQFDTLKFIAINIIPSLGTFWLTIGGIWNLPYTNQIGATIAAIGVLIAGCIGLSKAAYEKAKREQYEGETDDE